MMQTSPIMTTYSLVRQQEKNNYRILTTSTPNDHTQLCDATSSSILNLHTPTMLTTVGKEYMCFQKDGKISQAVRCIKSRITIKAIDSILSIDTFDQQFVVIKGMSQ